MDTQLPTAEEINVSDTLDGRCAVENFLGKSLEEAESVFRENFRRSQEDLRFMGPKAFCFYLPAAISYLRSAASEGNSDAVRLFCGMVEHRLGCDLAEIAPTGSSAREGIVGILEHIERCGLEGTIDRDLADRACGLLFRLRARRPRPANWPVGWPYGGKYLDGVVAIANAASLFDDWRVLWRLDRLFDQPPEWVQEFETVGGPSTFERKHGVTIPAALKEFWSRPDVMCAWCVDDQMDVLEEPLVKEWQGSKYLTFEVHLHSGSFAAVPLDGSDNPPVVLTFFADDEGVDVFCNSFTEYLESGCQQEARRKRQ